MQQDELSLSEDKPPSYVDLHTHSFMTGGDILRLQNIFPDVSGESDLPEYFSIGIHPKNIDPEFIERDLNIMEDVLPEKGCLAVGECGLDKFSLIDLQLQEKVFAAQIELAKKYDLPVVIHSVRSWQDILRIKKKHAPDQTWIVHGFHSTAETAESLIRHNILLSFGESIADENSKARETIKEMDIENFFLETDESVLPIEAIYRIAANLLDMEIDELRAGIRENFRRVFGV